MLWRADGSMLKGALTKMARGKRPKGRLEGQHQGIIRRNWSGKLGAQAYDREQWKELVLAAKSLNGCKSLKKKNLCVYKIIIIM